MSRVCYTQVGSCESQIFTLAAGNPCVCVHFPRPASRISSRCQCCIFRLPTAFFVSVSSSSPNHQTCPETFSIETGDCSKLWERIGDPHTFEQVHSSATRCWGSCCCCRLIWEPITLRGAPVHPSSTSSFLCQTRTGAVLELREETNTFGFCLNTKSNQKHKF